MNNLITATILANISEEKDGYNDLLKEVKTELREQGINPSNKQVRSRLKARLKKLGKDKNEVSCILKSVMSSEEVSKDKDFPNTKGKDYRKIKESVIKYLQNHFKDLNKEYASEEEIKNMISEGLDKTSYRYLSRHLNDLTSDILKSLKTMNVYVVEKPEKG